MCEYSAGTVYCTVFPDDHVGDAPCKNMKTDDRERESTQRYPSPLFLLDQPYSILRGPTAVDPVRPSQGAPGGKECPLVIPGSSCSSQVE